MSSEIFSAPASLSHRPLDAASRPAAAPGPAAGTGPVLWACTGLRHAVPGAEEPLFGGMDLCIAPGATLLRGGDGRGKTTLLRIMAGQLHPRQGRIDATARDVFWMDPRSDGAEGGGPKPQQTPEDWWAAQAARRPGWSADALAAHVRGFGLAEHAGKRMEQLSTGTRRKVLLAAGLASGAALVLVDEPVAGLDRASIAYLRQCLCDVVAAASTSASPADGTAVVVAHYDTLGDLPWTQRVDLGD